MLDGQTASRLEELKKLYRHWALGLLVNPKLCLITYLIDGQALPIPEALLSLFDDA